jgi:four helix bundle protein
MYKEVLPLLPPLEERNVYSQIQRASTSIVLNIVEGASHRSNKVFLNHLQYAYGSCKEVDVLLMICHDLSYVSADQFRNLAAALEELKAGLYQFMKRVDAEVVMERPNYSF